jgi:hypothetical protein
MEAGLMSYETRGGKQYYYQVRRVHGRLVKSYVGSGPVAEQAAADVARRQQERADAKRLCLEFETRLQAFRSDFEAFWSHSEQILQLAFMAANYHRRKGEWRRRRESSH